MTEKYQDFIGEDFEGVIKNLLKLEAEKSYEGYKGDALDIAWKRHILILLKNMTKKKKIILASTRSRAIEAYHTIQCVA